MNTKDLVDRDGITIAATHLGLAEDPGERPWLHDAWSVTLTMPSTPVPSRSPESYGTYTSYPPRTLTTSYKTGIGHRKIERVCDWMWNSRELDRRLLVPRPYQKPLGIDLAAQYYAKTVPPDAASVLDALLSDATAEDEIFEDWCATFGADTDSRKALETYLACQRCATDLRRLLGDKYAEYRDAGRL